MKVHDLKPAPGSRRPKRRVGRGIGYNAIALDPSLINSAQDEVRMLIRAFRHMRQWQWLRNRGAPESSSWPAGSRLTFPSGPASAMTFPPSSIGVQPNSVSAISRSWMPPASS